MENCSDEDEGEKAGRGVLPLSGVRRTESGRKNHESWIDRTARASVPGREKVRPRVWHRGVNPTIARHEKDWLTEAGAAELCARIQSYWLHRGKIVSIWVVQEEASRSFQRVIGDHGAVWSVRSDMIGGLPR